MAELLVHAERVFHEASAPGTKAEVGDVVRRVRIQGQIGLSFGRTHLLLIQSGPGRTGQLPADMLIVRLSRNKVGKSLIIATLTVNIYRSFHVDRADAASPPSRGEHEHRQGSGDQHR
jgi:hypothetical protein